MKKETLIKIPKKCSLCGGKLYVNIFKNKAGMKQQGLYCSLCEKYYKFLTNREVYYCKNIGLTVKNSYGDLSNTELWRL